MSLIKIASRAEVQAEKLLQQRYKDTPIILLEHQGEVKAFQGICPHQGSSLANGHIEDKTIVCSLHQWKFSCLDGKNPQHNTHLKQYTVVEKEGQLVSIRRSTYFVNAR